MSKLINLLSQNSQDSNMLCEFCNLTRHVKEKCFALHGYLEWHRLHGQPKPKPKQFNKRFTVNSTNSANVFDNPKSEIPPTPKDTTSAILGLLDSQYQQLISLLNQKNTNVAASSNAAWIAPDCAGNIIQCTHFVANINQVQFDSSMSSWIVDSGATHHITPYAHLLVNAKNTKSELLLPNGNKTSVIHGRYHSY